MYDYSTLDIIATNKHPPEIVFQLSSVYVKKQNNYIIYFRRAAHNRKEAI